MIRPAGLKMSRMAFIAILAAGLMGAGFVISPRETNTVVAAEGASAPVCRVVEVALDEGYSVSRTETREVCGGR